jgi:hypothetical protein
MKNLARSLFDRSKKESHTRSRSIVNKRRFMVLSLMSIACCSLLLAPSVFHFGVNAQKGGSGSQGSGGTKGQERQNGLTPHSVKASAFAVSRAVKDLPPGKQSSSKSMRVRRGEVDINEKNREGGRKIAPDVKSSPDAALVSPRKGLTPTTAPPAPAVSFDGVSSQDNADEFGFRVSPPDTQGDVGPNHYVQGVNLLVRIFDKSGTPLTAPFKQSDLFAPLGGVCASFDDGDPIILYDPLADRWLISQFALPNFPLPPYSMCVAISTTPDPTGTYFLYNFITGGASGAQFPDYPKFGVWPDGYYLTVRQFTNGGPFANPGAVVFDRLAMLSGDPNAQQIYFDLSALPPVQNIDGMLPSDLDGLVPPPLGAPNVFSYYTAAEFGDPGDGLRLFDFHADFVTPANSTFTERPESPIAVAAFDPISPLGRADIPQPGTTARLDSITEFSMYRMQYRNRGGFESLVLNHSVDASGDPTAAVFRAGVRFYELRRNIGAPRPQGVGNPYSIFEQATFAPADTENRWMGSAAVDNNGNLAFGYSVASATVFPSIRYAGKLAGEAVGVLAETNMITGSGSQTSAGSRWGDYSMMAVDPVDDCTFWYTQEYYTAASQATSTVGWLTRIASFRFAECVAAPKGAIDGTITNCSTGDPIPNATITTPEGFFSSSDVGGGYIIAASPGTYTVTASFPGFLPATGMVVVADGNTSTLNLCLIPTAVIGSAGATIVTEGCTPANGVIDPDETVTVSLCLQNTGAADTVNLVGTLQATGGVTSPSGPQNYGVVIGGGPAVCRNFTFTAVGTCGATITASLQLQDGASDLGTVTYTFTLGVLNTVFAENFDGVVAPALPAGWTATTLQDIGSVSNPWASTSTTPDTAPNAVFTNDPNNISDEVLDTPTIAITSSTAQLTFRNNFDLEDTFDGAVLEISIGGGGFTDIIAAGGSFVSGGYTDLIDNRFGNPLSNRNAWSGSSAGYITTIANLPASAAGQNVVLRFRRGTDNSVADQFWRVDTISLTDGFNCCGTIVCTITCPADITVSNDPNQCGAVVNYPAPTADAGCGTITCTPPSGSFFPVGTTTVTCTTTAGPTCSFTVTVNDTQPPSITCPANVVAIGAPGSTSVVVNYPPPTASDNCPGVTASCTPPSGSTFPVGTTTVTCTATDAAGNTAICSFTVSVFDVILQDDSNPTIQLIFNSSTGQYIFCCLGTSFTGTGKIKKVGSTITLEHNSTDRRVRGSVSGAANPPRGNGSIQFNAGSIACTIADRDIRNNTPNCGGTAPPPPQEK